MATAKKAAPKKAAAKKPAAKVVEEEKNGEVDDLEARLAALS
jgi:hypothetical protein